MNLVSNEVDEYISHFPENIQVILEQIRETIRKAAPQARETIKYKMPTYVLNNNLVHFAAFKNHIGFYPVPTAIEAFKEDLSGYKGAKGSVQFPLDKPVPLDLISRIVKFRVEEDQKKAVKKKNERVCENGHTYYKTSDCPTCPICEQESNSQEGFLSVLGAPARRALENNGITSLQQLATLTEKEVLEFHGLGKSSIPKLRQALSQQGLDFKN